jgi:hypothetical protein
MQSRRLFVAFGLSFIAIFLFGRLAQAGFPVPGGPPGIIQGDPDPEPPTITPPVIPPPPDDPFCPPDNGSPVPPVTPQGTPCHGGGITSTPEPATVISGLLGASLLGGYIVRRRKSK